jgi:hypothetical protein
MTDKKASDAKDDLKTPTPNANQAADKTAPKGADGKPVDPALESKSGTEVGAGDVRETALQGAKDGDADNNVGSVTTDPLDGVPTQYTGGTSHEEEENNGLGVSTPSHDLRDGVPLTDDGLPKLDPEQPFIDGKPNLTESGQQALDDKAANLPDAGKMKAGTGETLITAIDGFTHGVEDRFYSLNAGQTKSVPKADADEIVKAGLAQKA